MRTWKVAAASIAINLAFLGVALLAVSALSDWALATLDTVHSLALWYLPQ